MISSYIKRFALFFLLFATCVVSQNAFSDDTTKRYYHEFFNIHPSDDDVIVYLPCDGVMVFKKIYTSLNLKSKLRDSEFFSGSINNKSPLSMGQRTSHIQGAFKDTIGYFYLISKYELMEGQYQILKNSYGNKCPTLNIKSRLPAVNHTFLDYMSVAEKMSSLLVNAKGNFRSIDNNVSTFVRLPTDDEWEYAARGGNSVNIGSFDANLPISSDQDISDYAWHSGSQSSNGNIQLTALKKATHGDLYDILGNSQEIVVEPFKAVVGNRFLGISGGLCVRGGSITTSKANLSSAYRAEIPYYNKKGQPNKLTNTTTRFVLSSLVFNSQNEVKSLKKELSQIVQNHNNVKNSLPIAKESVETLLEEKQNTHIDKKLKEQLKKISDKLDSVNLERDRMRKIAVTEKLRLGGFLCKSIKEDASTALFYKKQLFWISSNCQYANTDIDKCEGYSLNKKQLDIKEKSLEDLLSYYGDNVANAIYNYDRIEFSESLEEAKNQLNAQNINTRFIDIYFKHLNEYTKSSKDLEKNKKIWIRDCVKVNNEK
ncbi:MAG: SUMF1/EgtB/PvdO family nonheme iron enzyme [Succinatimonas sp.]|nr:SUMF1/EgtB/PvdO family nonheme iron enzyme [Succinatimonas sp.]